MPELEPIEPEEISRVVEEPSIKADILAEEIAKTKVNELSSKVSQAVFDQVVENQASASRKLLVDVSEELKFNGNDISVALTELEVNQTPEAQIAQSNPSLYTSFKELVGRVSQTIEDIIKNRTNNKVENLIDENNKAAEEYYKDPTDNAKKTAFDKTQKALRKALIDSSDPDVQKLEKEVESTKKGNWKKWVETLLKVLKFAGFAYGIYAIVKAIVDAETGCYQFRTDANGTLTSTKLPCPNNKDDSVYCRCGLQNETCTSNQKLPYCCQAGSLAYNQPCKGQAGKPDSIYYGWKQQTFAGFFNDAIKIISDLPKEVESLGSGLWKILKYVLYILLGIVGVVVLFYILKFLFTLFKDSKDSKDSRYK